jgi:hypothetical protein
MNMECHQKDWKPWAEPFNQPWTVNYNDDNDDFDDSNDYRCEIKGRKLNVNFKTARLH